MIYKLFDLDDLGYDLNQVLNRITPLFHVWLEDEVIRATCLAVAQHNGPTIGDETSDAVGTLNALYQSIHRDMYAMVEALSRISSGKFDTKELESTYSLFKQFRELNNRIKHREEKSVQIDPLTFVTFKRNKLDIIYSFKYTETETVFRRPDEFVALFFKIMVDFGAIILEEKSA